MQPKENEYPLICMYYDPLRLPYDFGWDYIMDYMNDLYWGQVVGPANEKQKYTIPANPRCSCSIHPVISAAHAQKIAA